MTADPVSPRDLVALPRAAALMLWTAAYQRGDIGPDDAADLSYGVSRSGPSTQEGATDLFAWMTGLRRLPLAQLRLVLPVPGRIAGLVGPPPAISAALLAEQAIVVTAAGIADHTLVPELGPAEGPATRSGAILWRRFPAPVGAQLSPAASSGTARQELLEAMRRAARSSTDLDLVPDEPVEPSRVPPTWTATELPAHIDAQQSHLLVLASRTLLLTRAELEDGSAHTRQLSQEQERRRLLAELHDAAREAVVEAVEQIAHAVS